MVIVEFYLMIELFDGSVLFFWDMFGFGDSIWLVKCLC